jgi:hypothetical protein
MIPSRVTLLLSLGTIVLLMVSMDLNAGPSTTDTDSPSNVVQALYRASLSHFTGFSKQSVILIKPWLAPELYARLWKKADEPQPKDEVPDVDGDIFLDSQEPPSRFEIGNVSADHNKATVELKVKWPHEDRVYRVQVEQTSHGWKVYDVQFGKDGNLTDLL